MSKKKRGLFLNEYKIDLLNISNSKLVAVHRTREQKVKIGDS